MTFYMKKFFQKDFERYLSNRDHQGICNAIEGIFRHTVSEITNKFLVFRFIGNKTIEDIRNDSDLVPVQNAKQKTIEIFKDAFQENSPDVELLLSAILGQVRYANDMGRDKMKKTVDKLYNKSC